MRRTYKTGLTQCLGDCGDMLRARTASREYPNHRPRQARGMCARCYEKTYCAAAADVHPDRVRYIQAEIDYYLAGRRKRGIPAEGLHHAHV